MNNKDQKPQLAIKLLGKAVASTKDACKEFFKDRRLSPDRLFCTYDNPQQEDLSKFHGFQLSDSGEKMTFRLEIVDLALIRMDEALNSQDRRDLDSTLIRTRTMLSFQKNADEINAPAAILRYMGDGTYMPGDARHRIVWSHALGCTKARAYVYFCPDDEVWNSFREDMNDMNGVERSEEERLLIVYRKHMKGGYGSIRDLCRRHGIAESRFNDFKERQATNRLAADKGLQVSPTTPPEVVQIAVRAVEKGATPQVAQQLIEALNPVQGVPKRANEEVIKNIEKSLEEKGYTEEAIAEAAGDVREEIGRSKTGKRTRGTNRDHSSKFMEGIDSAIRSAKGSDPTEIGMPEAVIQNYVEKVETILHWLQKGIQAKKDE